MKPRAWSHTQLANFENCPRQYEACTIQKRFPFQETAETKWGKEVHTAFEHYLLNNRPLTADLQVHAEFLNAFRDQPGELAGEERIALDTNLQACGYFDKKVEVWYRGQVDARKRDRARGFSHLLDHKTGKVKNDYTQLKSFAMWEFLTQPDIHTVRADYYWTQIKGTNGETYHREQLPELLRFFAEKLHRWADAHISETFPPRRSGLCAGWCPVTDCENWTPKRPRP